LTIKSAQHTKNSSQSSVYSPQLKAQTSALTVDCRLLTALVAQIRLLLIPPDFDPGGTNTCPGPMGPELVDTALSVFKDR
jgi:hypothetical protein